MTKKGAIELSMTTIIVIVLGVTLLILGFAFIKGIFANLEGISGTTFEKAETLLGGLENVDNFLTVSPTQINIEQGKDDVVKVIVANQENNRASMSVALTAVSTDEDLDCILFHETASEDGRSTSTKSISSGQQVSYSLIIKDKGGDLRSSGCNIGATVTDGKTPADSSRQVFVRVVKPSGLFG